MTCDQVMLVRAVRVRVSSWTASFRYSGFMIGIQPTLPMPPLSTVYGLLSAAAGRTVTPYDTFVGYTFRSRGRTTDLERIVEIAKTGVGKWNVIRRELLMDAQLDLYVSTDMEGHLRSPRFPLLLGRTSDLASVDSIERVELEHVTDQKGLFGESIYTEAPAGYPRATVYPLPIYFTDTIPRRAIGTRPFVLIDRRFEGVGNGYLDAERGIIIELFSAESLGLGATQ